MPQVGTGKTAMHFPYTEKGMKDAMSAAKKTGMPMKMKPAMKKRMAQVLKGKDH